MSILRHLGQPWSILWRKALLSLPRAVPDVVIRYTSPEGPHPVVIKIPSRSRHLIPLYAFIPPSALEVLKPSANPRKIPVLIDFHGGGFIFGSCHEQAPFCAMFARELGCLVLSVDYRLGPIDKFPAAIEDAEDVLNAVLNPIEPGYYELRDSISEHVSANLSMTGLPFRVSAAVET
jgi:acetyl esterase/lipase